MKIKNIAIAFLFFLSVIFSFYLYQENQKLTDKNESLTEMLHFEQYGELELIPCSICHHEVNISRINNRYYIRCCECGFETEAYDKIQDVIDRWNFINNSGQN